MTGSGSTQIGAYLATLKASGRSSPAGRWWQDFYAEITRGSDGTTRPLVPLILAASNASDGEKHHRLEAQLVWAEENGVLDRALAFLDRLPADAWNRADAGNWSKSFSWDDE